MPIQTIVGSYVINQMAHKSLLMLRTCYYVLEPNWQGLFERLPLALDVAGRNEDCRCAFAVRLCHRGD